MWFFTPRYRSALCIAAFVVFLTPPVAAQELYEELGQVLRQVLATPNPDIRALLDASVVRFQSQVLDVINAENE